MWLYSVPVDWEEVRSFLSNSISKINNLYFNNDDKVELSASKYLESLKVASSKTINLFAIDKTNFSLDEFRELVCAAKGAKRLGFQCNIIPLDKQVDFGNMEGCKIECLGFYSSGGSSYSNWKSHPMRYENLVASIAKSEGLINSMKTLYIGEWEIAKDKAQEVLNKYNLKSISLEGV